MRENSLEKIYMVIPWGPPVQRLTSFFNKINFSISRQKKDHLQTLQTILHRIGPFISLLAHSSAHTNTPLQKFIRFEHPVLGEKIFFLPSDWVAKGILCLFVNLKDS